MLTYLLILTLPVTTGALLYMRRDYRVHGRMSALGLTLCALMLFLPNLMLHYATYFELPHTVTDFIGAGISLAGLALCLVGIVVFHQVLKVVGLRTGTLAVAGPYRWGRNPQYVGWFFFLLGYAIMDWSAWCLAAMIVVAVCLHLTVLVEEEHLRRTFDAQYNGFCHRIPRYAGRSREHHA